MNREELFDRVLKLLKGPESGYIDFLQTLVDMSGDYLNINELKDLAKSDPYKIARNLIEEEIIDERYFIGDSKISDIIKKTSQGYEIYSHNGKRLSKPLKTLKEAKERLKQIETFKHMHDSRYRGYDIEYKGDLWQVWRDTPEGDEKIAGDFDSEEEAKAWIDAQYDVRPIRKEEPVKKQPETHHYDVYYTDYATDQTYVEKNVEARSPEEARKKVKQKYGKGIYGYPHDVILKDEKKEIKDMKRFICRSYFSDERDGLEDSFETDNISEAKEWIWKKSQYGYYTKLDDNGTGVIYEFDEIEDPEELVFEGVPADDDIVHLWIVVWHDDKGRKHSVEFDSEEDAKEFLAENTDESHHEIKIEERDQNMKDCLHVKDALKPLNKEQIEKQIRDVLTPALKKMGHSDDDIKEWVTIRFKNFTNDYGDKGVMVEIANDLVDYYDLKDETRNKLDAIVDPAYFEPYSATIWQAYIFDRRIDDSVSDAIKNNACGYHIEVKKNGKLVESKRVNTLAENFKAVKELEAKYGKGYEVTSEELYEDNGKEGIDEIRYYEANLDKMMDSKNGEIPRVKAKLVKVEKVKDSQKYIYQFPADLNKRDLAELKNYNLELLGRVKDKVEMVSGDKIVYDYAVRGTKEDLERYCSDYLDYSMHPDFLYLEEDYGAEIE